MSMEEGSEYESDDETLEFSIEIVDSSAESSLADEESDEPTEGTGFRQESTPEAVSSELLITSAKDIIESTSDIEQNDSETQKQVQDKQDEIGVRMQEDDFEDIEAEFSDLGDKTNAEQEAKQQVDSRVEQAQDESGQTKDQQSELSDKIAIEIGRRDVDNAPQDQPDHTNYPSLNGEQLQSISLDQINQEPDCYALVDSSEPKNDTNPTSEPIFQEKLDSLNNEGDNLAEIEQQAESNYEQDIDEQQLERQQQLIEEQLIDLVDQSDEKVSERIDIIDNEVQQDTQLAYYQQIEESELELDLTFVQPEHTSNSEIDQVNIDIVQNDDCKNTQERALTPIESINSEATNKPQMTFVNQEVSSVDKISQINSELEQDNSILEKATGDRSEAEIGNEEASDSSEIIQAGDKKELDIPDHNTELDAEVHLNTNVDSHEDATPTVQLDSPNIRLNGGRMGFVENEICNNLKSDIDSELAMLILDESEDEVDDETVDEDDHEYSDCKTPTAQNLLLDSNLLGYINNNSEQLFSSDSDQEDLEAEFDNEPAFESRQVTPKRNVAPTSEYDFADELGRGKFGTVYRVRNKLSGLELAAKMISIRRQEDLKDVEREVAIMCILQHPRLLQLYDAFVDFQPMSPNVNGSKQICIITELIEGGELFERIIDDDFNLTEKKAAIFMRQICEGVDYMHSMGIVHLDMKPENILCVSKTSNRIKLIDFGLARKIEPGQTLRVMFGTPDFAAPEVLGYDVVSYATDMWSVGVICYVLLSGLSPFMGDSDVETMANVQRATYDFDSDAFEPITDLAKDFIRKLLVKDPKLRLKPGECLQHPWLEKGGRLLDVAMKSRRESIISIMSTKSDSYDLTNIIGPSGICSLTSLNKRNLKRYVIRRKWHKTVNAIMALGRMGANLKLKLIGSQTT